MVPSSKVFDQLLWNIGTVFAHGILADLSHARTPEAQTLSSKISFSLMERNQESLRSITG
jgi:hypothetical protein